MKIKMKSILGYLDYARLIIAGAIGGLAIYNTAMLILSASPTQSFESIAMASGAILTAGLVKVLHVA